MSEEKRVRVVYSIDPETDRKVRELSEGTMVPMSRLVERAILEYLARRQEAEGAGTKQRA